MPQGTQAQRDEWLESASGHIAERRYEAGVCPNCDASYTAEDKVRIIYSDGYLRDTPEGQNYICLVCLPIVPGPEARAKSGNDED
jgi:hypothetical protein